MNFGRLLLSELNLEMEMGNQIQTGAFGKKLLQPT
jgi:hypothetical protein